jgi:hypothetical protein
MQVILTISDEAGGVKLEANFGADGFKTESNAHQQAMLVIKYMDSINQRLAEVLEAESKAKAELAQSASLNNVTNLFPGMEHFSNKSVIQPSQIAAVDDTAGINPEETLPNGLYLPIASLPPTEGVASPDEPHDPDFYKLPGKPEPAAVEIAQGFDASTVGFDSSSSGFSSSDSSSSSSDSSSSSGD